MGRPKVTDPATLSAQEIVDGYRIVGKWKGFVQYGCNFCAYDSLNVPVIREHVIQVHQFQLIESQEHKVEVTLFDAGGKQVSSRPMTQSEVDAHNEQQVDKYRS